MHWLGRFSAAMVGVFPCMFRSDSTCSSLCCWALSGGDRITSTNSSDAGDTAAALVYFDVFVWHVASVFVLAYAEVGCVLAFGSQLCRAGGACFFTRVAWQGLAFAKDIFPSTISRVM